MDFRVLLLAVGIALGTSLAAPLAGSAGGPFPGYLLPGAGAWRSPVLPPCPQAQTPHCVSPIVQAEFVRQSSSLKNAVFRSVLHNPRAEANRQAEGVRFSGHIDELPLKEHLPVWVF
ncbi:hypothetical protein HX881_16055 [Pseudomonas gingeri]|uniref:hypothetical protein n=1 Tax=Pseudomonas gingeri TaxID=117681 RepID=UPI0015A440E1|nr:hypothetical protein [Pseudomonas gingeri]NVZ27068.1 hypothetical protein [Pseudomonas gingeri]